MKRLLTCLACASVAMLVSLTYAVAQEPGQADLDAAIDLKFDANSLDDWNRVIDLCESALKKGLDEDGKLFAGKLLSATLYQRANALAEALLFTGRPIDQRAQIVYRQCLADMERAVELDDTLSQAYLLLGRLHAVRGGDQVKAGQALERAIELADDDPTTKAHALVAMSGLRADDARRLKDLDQAIELAPQDAQAYRVRGMIKLRANEAEAGLADLDRALELEPDHAATHEARGMALTLLNRPDEARASFDKAVELAPDSATMLLRRAQAHLLAGNDAEAEADTTEALKRDENNPQALLMRAEARLKQGSTEEALEDVNRVLELAPSAPPALRMHAAVMAALDRLDAAIADLEAVRKRLPNDTETIFQLGLLYMNKRRVSEAIDAFTDVLAIDAKNWRALRSRATAYLSIGKQAEAITDYERAIKLKPDDGESLNNLAWVLATSPDEKLRDGQRSIKLGTQACELTDYKAAHILSTLAAGYAETGDFETAIKWSTKAVELGDDELKPQLQEELDSYKAKKPWRELQSVDDLE